MASQRIGTLYVGSTSDLIKRFREHKTKAIPTSFTAQYNVHMLVYYVLHVEAARREQRLKIGAGNGN